MKCKLLLALVLTIATCGCQKNEDPAAKALPVIGVSDFSIHESDGFAAFIFKLDQPAESAASFDIDILDGTAKSSIDYIMPSQLNVAFPAGVKTQTFYVYLINDHIRRPDRSFKVKLRNPVGLVIKSDSATVKIINDNITPEVNFATSAQAVDKSTGLASIQVQTSVPAPERFDIPYLVSGNAGYGVDHNFLSGIVTIQAGESTALIQGTLIDTTEPNSNKTIVFKLQSISGLALGQISTHTMVIADQLSNLVALASNAPSGVSNLRTLDVSIVGYNVTQYKYKLSSANNCSLSSGYSPPVSIDVPVTDSLEPLPDGDLFLCLIGGDPSGAYQDLASATVVTWTKNTSPPNPPTLNQITSVYRSTGTSSVLSSSPLVTAEFLNLSSGFTLVLYDSMTCDPLKQIGSAVVAGSPQLVTGTYVGDGDHVLSAVLVDQYSQKSSCSVLLSKYTLDSVAPKVTDVTTNAVSGYYQVGQTIQVTVTFSKPIEITGPITQRPYLVLNTVPTNAVAPYLSSSGNTITFMYQIVAGQNSTSLDYASQSSLVASGSTIKDFAGNDASLLLPVANSSGTIASKATIVVDTTAPVPVLAITDGLWGTATQTPLINWLASSDPGGSGIRTYQIAIGTDSGLSDVLAWTDVATTSFQQNMTLVPGETYYASVRVIDKAGNISAVTTADGFVIDNTPPTTPYATVSASTTYDNSQSPKISWNQSTDDVSGLDHYEVALGKNPGATDVVYWIDVGTVTSYIVSYSAQFNQNYYASVRAIDRAGNVSPSTSASFLVMKPVVDPNPFPVFTDKNDVPQGSTVFSNTWEINGLSIPSGVSVSATGGNAQVSVNGGSYVNQATIKNGDSIQLKMTAPLLGDETFTATISFGSQSTTWKVSTWLCPVNYVYVPATSVQSDFCVSKYQIHTVGTPGNEVGSSEPNSSPSLIDRSTAIRACAAVGSQYSLISNSQWQTIARNIESVGWNWSGSISGSGMISGGVISSTMYSSSLPVSSADDEESCIGASIGCDLNTWSKYRRVMKLSTEKYIWDFTGLSWQWVTDEIPSANFDDSMATFCPNGSSSTCYYNIGELTSEILKNLFGPAQNYQGLFPMNTNSDWGGIGQVVDPHPTTVHTTNFAIARGGERGDETSYWHGGLFSGRLSEGTHQKDSYGVTTWKAFRTSSSGSMPIPYISSFGCSYPDCDDASTSSSNCVDLTTCASYYYNKGSTAEDHGCSSQLNVLGPQGMAFDGSSFVYVLDSGNYRVQKINALTGQFDSSFGSKGINNGQFLAPIAIAVDQSGYVYVADAGLFRISKFSPSGVFQMSFGERGSSPGQLGGLRAITVDSTGNIWVVDGFLVKKFDSNGNYILSFGDAGNGPGQFQLPSAISIYGSAIYILDSGNFRVQKFNLSGNSVTYVGSFGSQGAGNSQFFLPKGLYVNSSGIYVADTYNTRVLRFNLSNNVQDLNFGTRGSLDSQFRNPTSLIQDASGNIWVSDTENYRVQIFSSGGTYLSQFGTYGSGNGQFKGPTEEIIGGQTYYSWEIACSTYSVAEVPASGLGAARCVYQP